MTTTQRTVKGRTVLIDSEDAEFFDSHTWSFAGKANEYLQTSVDAENKLFTRMIMNAPNGKDVDHINRDTTDNRKSNLRIVSRRANLCNKRKGKSKFRWVSKNNKKWKVQIEVAGKYQYFGTYHTPEYAGKVADSIAYLLFKDELESDSYNYSERFHPLDLGVEFRFINKLAELYELIETR